MVVPYILGQPSKVHDFNSFSKMFYRFISTTCQKIGDLFCLVDIFGLLHNVLNLRSEKITLEGLPVLFCNC